MLRLLTLVLLLCGCGMGRPKPNHPPIAPARGIVTYQGQPVDQAVVVFQPNAQPSIAASAFTDSKGKFDLKAFPPESGAVPGSYSVMIMKVSQEDAHPEGGKKAAVVTPKSLIPSKYCTPAKSGLINVEIPETGTETLIFELKD